MRTLLRQTLGIESGDEVKELMLGMASPALKSFLECSPLLMRGIRQNLGDQVEGFLVSDHDVPNPDLF